MKTNHHPFLAQVAPLFAVFLAALAFTPAPLLGEDGLEYRKEACEIHLLAAETHGREVIRLGAGKVSAFVNDRMRGARAAAKELTGWYASWRTTLGLIDRSGHETYVRRVFEKHLFSLPELNLAAARARAAIRRDLVAVENELAVALGQVLDVPPPAPGDIRALRTGFIHNVNALVDPARWDLAKSAGRAATIETLVIAAIRVLGAKLWLLWTGVGIAVDYALEKADDPVGDIVREIRLTLYEIAGTCEAAVEKEMTEVLKRRMVAWRRIVMEELK